MLRYIYYIFYSAAPFFASNAAKKIYFTPLTRGRNSAILCIVNSVHVEGGGHTNPMATSKEEILKTSRVLIQQNGWEAVNIRAVAAACGVSVGCIYNYFGSKTELVSAAVESIWSDIFRHPDDPAVFEDTLSCIRWMYRQLEYGSAQYPGFFTHHALGFVRQDTADGKQQMRQTWQHILDALTMVLTRDKKIRPDAFTEEFSRQKFAGILFSLMLSAVVQQDFDPTAVLEIIRRTIYEV